MDDLIYDLYAPRNDATADLRRARLDRFAAAALGALIRSYEERQVLYDDGKAAEAAATAAEALLAELERRELEPGEVAP
jgi:hypothetical protein